MSARGVRRGSAADRTWRALAESRGGTVQDNRLGGLRAVRLAHRSWELLLDRHTVSTGKTQHTYTRVRALFRAPLPLRMRIAREHVLHRIGKLFGMQDIQLGEAELDGALLIRGDAESMIRSLLMDRDLARRLVADRKGAIELKSWRGRRGERPERVAVLSYQRLGVVKDAPALDAIVVLFMGLLDGLRRIGAAADEPVGHTL